MDAFNWLHLTDLHWGLTGQNPLWSNIREQFFKDLEVLRPKTGPWHAVLFTGDLVQQGTPDEFDSLEDKVLGPLWERFRQLDCNPVLLTVPGNHDLKRPDAKSRSAAVRWLRTPGRFQEIAEEFWEDDESEYRREVHQAFAGYRQWWAARPHCSKHEIDDGRLLPGDFTTTFQTAGGHRIGILGLNTTFLQLGDQIKAKHLACDLRQFQQACKEQDVAGWAGRHNVCLLMTHQGPDWLDDPSRKKQYPAINPAGRFAVHLFGHMHQETLRGFSQGGGHVVRWWQGCSLFGLEHYGDQKKEDRRHGYSAGTIAFDGDQVLLRHWPRAATHDEVNDWRFVRDEVNCVLQDDGGTAAEDVSLRKRRGGPAVPPPEPIEQLTARALGHYHQAAQRDWDDRWSGVVGEDQV